MRAAGRKPRRGWGAALLLAIGGLLALAAGCQTTPAPPATVEKFPIEARALDLLKASSAKLAAARTLTFTAVVSYEHPSRFGPPLLDMTTSQVTLQRPDKLRVLTAADGPPQEFYYDGKTMTAFSPKENLVAVADAPPTIDAALEAGFKNAAIYFPFADVIVADPYQDIADGLEMAFYIGQSKVLDGTTTDMVAYATYGTFVQIWIGAEDKLPRRLRAMYADDPAQLRHQLDLANWRLDPPLPADSFRAPVPADAKRIPFVDPGAPPAGAAKP